MNLKVLNPSRKKVWPGDIFVMQIHGQEQYIFGRLISLDVAVGVMTGCHLIYIYNAFSDHKEDIPPLDKNNLLIPPAMTNRQPWLKGYFETVESRELSIEDCLEQHCFLCHFDGKYYDDKNNVLPHRYEPCGEYGVGSYRTIDDDISTALGVPLADN